MKIYSNFIEKERWERAFQDLSHLDFSLFYDYPNIDQTMRSSINIFVACEPNEYFGHHDWVVKNNDYFSFILTWSDKILNKCDNAMFCPYGESWMQDKLFEYEPIDKEFKISFLRGDKKKLYGHDLRFEIFDRQDEIKNPIQFWDKLGNPNDWKDWSESKIKTFKPYQYSVCIENTSHRGYFTEKITDCILQKTVPIYFGCSNIHEFYNPLGIIQVRNVDDMITAINRLEKYDYDAHFKDAVDENFKRALEYKDYVANIKSKIVEVFKLNHIL
jgi:hypothetical protein